MDMGGNHELLDETVRRATCYYCKKLTGNDADADDLTQKALEHYVRARDSFRGNSKGELVRYLKTIAFRLHLDALRRKVPDIGGYYDEVVGGVASPAPSPLERLLVSDLLKWVEGQLNTLAELLEPAEKEVLQALIDRIEQIDYEALSRELGIPVNTLKSKLCRLRKLLREKLGEEPL